MGVAGPTGRQRHHILVVILRSRAFAASRRIGREYLFRILRGSPKRLEPQDDATRSNNCLINIVIRPFGDINSFMIVK
jgi:hypothetical protein